MEYRSFDREKDFDFFELVEQEHQGGVKCDFCNDECVIDESLYWVWDIGENSDDSIILCSDCFSEYQKKVVENEQR